MRLIEVFGHCRASAQFGSSDSRIAKSLPAGNPCALHWRAKCMMPVGGNCRQRHRHHCVSDHGDKIGIASCCRETILALWPTCLNLLRPVAPSAVAVPGPSSVESCASASVCPIRLEGVRRRYGFIRYVQRTSGPRRSLKRLRGLRMGCLIGRGSSVRHAGAWHINGSSGLTGLNDLRPGRPSVAVAMNLSLRGVGVFALCFMRRGGLLPGDTCISGVARLTSRRAGFWNRFYSSART
jgi:hypothetical protein